ncbi:hypothetical protein BT96DRAFT_919136 [Gymnopus androsaceus JB14]|uniref:CENP-V/GFA domain-containing protein n=1 Tax=Gymnopus androsaceus JB14 TaxID=1447944 RepID=A0A6A4HSA1_9AGAR|nr:hypothetical protein BT96DRAFT_919136 [Gymnopus androsaceus JB14]
MTTVNDTIRDGSCLCRSVRFTIKGEPFHYLVCHCDNCKKASGSAFMTNVWFKEEAFTITAGQDVLKRYQDTNTKTGKPLSRHFCSNCGSNLFLRISPDLPRSDVVIISNPAIDGGHVWKPRKESFPTERFSWIKHLEMKSKEKSKL